MQETKEDCEAREELRAWLQSEGKTQAWLARTLELSAPSVGAWFDAGRPVSHHRELIEELTGGAVPASHWEYQSERDAKARARERMGTSGDAA